MDGMGTYTPFRESYGTRKHMKLWMIFICFIPGATWPGLLQFPSYSDVEPSEMCPHHGPIRPYQKQGVYIWIFLPFGRCFLRKKSRTHGRKIQVFHKAFLRDNDGQEPLMASRFLGISPVGGHRLFWVEGGPIGMFVGQW